MYVVNWIIDLGVGPPHENQKYFPEAADAYACGEELLRCAAYLGIAGELDYKIAWED